MHLCGYPLEADIICGDFDMTEAAEDRLSRRMNSHADHRKAFKRYILEAATEEDFCDCHSNIYSWGHQHCLHMLTPTEDSRAH